MSRPSISQIYSAFNMQSHRVFRRAMRDSSGGVLRVNDLVRAIVELDLTPTHPELASPSSVLTPLAPNQALDTDSSRLVPMSNEPALRELLERAWDIGIAQGLEATECESIPQNSDFLQHPHLSFSHQPMSRRVSATITPACLAASALIQRGRLPAGQLRAAAFESLGLSLPPALQAPVVRCGDTSAASQTRRMIGGTNSPGHVCDKAETNNARPTEAAMIDEALERWLLLQSIHDPDEHSQALEELTRIVQKIEHLN